MYGNYTPSEEYRSEDNPHTPTNLPEDLKDKCFRVFEHTETWSANSGAVKYVYPKTEEGYNDYTTMLDIMGFEFGKIIDYVGNSETTRMLVLERFDVRVKWGDKYTVENGGVEVLLVESGEKRKYTPGEGYTPNNLWKGYLYDSIEIVGDIRDI